MDDKNKNLMNHHGLKKSPSFYRFYSYLNVEDITDADYVPRKRVLKDFEVT